MKKLISSIITALIPFVLAVLMLAFPSRTVSIVFFMLALYILYGALRDLYVVLNVDALPPRVRNVSVVKNALNIILSVIVIFLSFSNRVRMKLIVFV